MTNRDNLTAAAQAVAAARARLDAARQLVADARAHLGDRQREFDALRANNRENVAASASNIVDSLRAGSTPAAVEGCANVNAGKVRDAQLRLAAARKAVAVLADEATQAEAELAAAKAEKAAAIKGVALAEAVEIAKRVEDLKQQVEAECAKLGGRYGWLRSATAPMPAALLKAAAASDFVTNTPAWRAMQDANAVWLRFAADLASDPQAELRFAE